MRTRVHTAAVTLLAALALCAAAGCSEDSSTEAPYVHVTITQPADSAVLRDSVVRVLTTLEKNCGCSAYVQFWVDGRLREADFVPDYSYDWDVHDLRGEHVLMARGVVEGKAEGRDSIRVTIDR
jgi:hypothetical protein